MSDSIMASDLATAVHALTGEWLSGDEAADLIERTGSREELLALGLLELGWIGQSDEGLLQFRALCQAASIAMAPLGQPPAPAAALAKALPSERLHELAARFAEDPAAADPFDALARLARS